MITGEFDHRVRPYVACRVIIPRLKIRRISRGIGGNSSYFVEPAILAFADKPHTRLYELELLVAEPRESNEGLPSLLGRDVVNHWYVEYDPTHSRLECTVRYADHTLDPA